VVVSGLVLNFVPDPAAAMAEARRVFAPGGLAAAYVWDYAGGMEMMRHFWDAAAVLDPAAAALDEGRRFPRREPAALERPFRGAGMERVGVPTPFVSFDDYWLPLLGGQGPVPGYAVSLGEAARDRLREEVRRWLQVASDGSIGVTARAWAVLGVAG